MCKSSTVKTPEKKFITIPRDVTIRKKWFTAMRRDVPLSEKTTGYCCTDHFDGLTACLTYYNRKNGLVTSGLLFQFWILCAIFGAPQFRTEIREAQIAAPVPYYNYISYIIYYPIVLALLFLNCFADKQPRESKYPKSDNPCPELKSSFLAKIVYSWFDALAWKGYRNPLETKDLWDMNPEDSAYEVVPKFDKNWQKIVKKAHGTQSIHHTNAAYKTDPASVDFVDSTTKKQASILPALVKTFGPMFLFGAFLKALQDILTFVSPQILRALIAFVENQEEQWKGFLYAGLLFGTAAIQTLILSQYFQRMFIVGMRIRTALISTIYRKALKMSNVAKKESTVGEIVNLMSVDAQKFIELTAYLNMIWSAPLQIILAIYFLWDILGPSVLAGLAVMIIMIPINGYIANKVKSLQIKQMKNKDERVKLMNEFRGTGTEDTKQGDERAEKGGVLKCWDIVYLVVCAILAAPLVIENGNFTWGDDAILKNINIRLPKNTLTAVVGQVGSGKSSLVSAFLGEMVRESGRVNTVGSIAYVSQQAWIQNATLQDNILFGKSLNRKLYDQIVEACALKPDLEMLPGGDQTEIGEKGINLSGGQKQRVSLARAVYADADIYFLDDPLSAVDSHVGKHIFEKVIGPHGVLRHKTRVLVTHGITYLPQTDKILVIKDGEVSETGTYQQLLDKKGAFSDFLMQHITEAGEEDDEELDELKNQLSSTQGAEELVRKLQTQISRTRTYSESGSDKVNGTLQHQNSIDKGSRKRSSTVELEQKKPETQKLIEVEKAETGSVKWDVYKHYLKSIGVFLTCSTLLLNLVFQGFSIGSNVWLTIWSADNATVVDGVADRAKRDMYLGVYGALGVGQALSIVSWEFIFAKGAIGCAMRLHAHLLDNVLRLPMSFFDRTPVGRLLSRFSSDINVVDLTLPHYIKTFIMNSFKVLGTLVVISYTTPIFIAVIIPIAVLYYFIQRFYVATSRQLKRLESVSRSPIYSHFGETVTGAQVIRAFDEKDRFIKESEGKVDFNQVCYYPSIMANRWLAVRLEMVGNLIILFAALFAVLSKDQTAGNVGLSVSYALQITQTLNWLVRMTSDVETNIVAVERVKEYGETEQEAPWEIPNKNRTIRGPTTVWLNSETMLFVTERFGSCTKECRFRCERWREK
ncbi:atp-binding cassette sub-family c [Holotrichia oblita]|uniref:Atp-binding cassette sub-family c n=1 Tax=Holotrichia oblita TaxID=644536 RepID=A0ACB9T2H0_HOLOL|nr:atp-binding cassette sub-family c [Holotrichia oblita]